MESLFYRLYELEKDNSVMTGMQREMLGMTLEANPGVALGAAVRDVFDYMGIKLKVDRLEAICLRLIKENSDRVKPPAEAGDPEAPSPVKKKAAFGKEMIEWIEKMHSSERLLAACGYNATLARQIYCEQDYLITDTICTLFLEDRWNASLIALQAAAAPWSGGKGGGNSPGETEYYDLSAANEDDPGWSELAKVFGPR